MATVLRRKSLTEGRRKSRSNSLYDDQGLIQPQHQAELPPLPSQAALSPQLASATAAQHRESPVMSHHRTTQSMSAGLGQSSPNLSTFNPNVPKQQQRPMSMAAPSSTQSHGSPLQGQQQPVPGSPIYRDEQTGRWMIAGEPLHDLERAFDLLRTNKFYAEGFLMKKVEIGADGRQENPRNPDAQWSKWFVQLTGTIMSIWNAADMDAAAKAGKAVPPQYLNLADAFLYPFSTPPDAAPAPTPYQFALNNAGLNRIVLCAPSQSSLMMWVNAIRLAAWERSRCNEIYTGTLLGLKEPRIGWYGPEGAPGTPSASRNFFDGPLKVRLPGDTEWRQLWAVVWKGATGDEASAVNQKKARRSSLMMFGKKKDLDVAPNVEDFPGVGQVSTIAFYRDKPTGSFGAASGRKDKEERERPICVAQSVFYASAIYPESEQLIERSTLFKLEGTFLNPAEGYKGGYGVGGRAEKQGFALVMLDQQSDSTAMLQWIVGLADTFKLYGRPRGFNYDPRDPSSFYFALPIGPSRDRQFLDRELVDELGITESRPRAIRATLHNILFDRMRGIKPASLKAAPSPRVATAQGVEPGMARPLSQYPQIGETPAARNPSRSPQPHPQASPGGSTSSHKPQQAAGYGSRTTSPPLVGHDSRATSPLINVPHVMPANAAQKKETLPPPPFPSQARVPSPKYLEQQQPAQERGPSPQEQQQLRALSPQGNAKPASSQGHADAGKRSQDGHRADNADVLADYSHYMSSDIAREPTPPQATINKGRATSPQSVNFSRPLRSQSSHEKDLNGASAYIPYQQPSAAAVTQPKTSSPPQHQAATFAAVGAGAAAVAGAAAIAANRPTSQQSFQKPLASPLASPGAPDTPLSRQDTADPYDERHAEESRMLKSGQVAAPALSVQTNGLAPGSHSPVQPAVSSLDGPTRGYTASPDGIPSATEQIPPVQEPTRPLFVTNNRSESPDYEDEERETLSELRNGRTMSGNGENIHSDLMAALNFVDRSDSPPMPEYAESSVHGGSPEVERVSRFVGPPRHSGWRADPPVEDRYTAPPPPPVPATQEQETTPKLGSSEPVPFPSSFAPNQKAQERAAAAQGLQDAQKANLTQPGRAGGKSKRPAWEGSDDEEEEKPEEEEDWEEVSPPKPTSPQVAQRNLSPPRSSAEAAPATAPVGIPGAAAAATRGLSPVPYASPPSAAPPLPPRSPARSLAGGNSPLPTPAAVLTQEPAFVPPTTVEQTSPTQPAAFPHAELNPHGLLYAGLQDKAERSARAQEAQAREFGAPLVSLPPKAAEPQIGLVGAITSHQKDKERAGGIGKSLADQQREKKAAEERQRELDEIQQQQLAAHRQSQMFNFMPQMMNPWMMGMHPGMGYPGMPGGGFDPMVAQQAMMAAQQAYMQTIMASSAQSMSSIPTSPSGGAVPGSPSYATMPAGGAAAGANGANGANGGAPSTASPQPMPYGTGMPFMSPGSSFYGGFPGQTPYGMFPPSSPTPSGSPAPSQASQFGGPSPFAGYPGPVYPGMGGMGMPMMGMGPGSMHGHGFYGRSSVSSQHHGSEASHDDQAHAPVERSPTMQQ